jgi:hypothetical protein
VQRLVSVRELDSWIKGSVRLDVTPGAEETRFFPEIRDALTPKPIPGAESVKGSPTLIEVSDTHDYYPPKGEKAPPPLTRDKWQPIEGKKKCPFAQRAVVVLGKRRAEVLDVCVSKECTVHWPDATPAAPVRTPGLRRPQAEIDAEKRQKAAMAKTKELEKARAELLKKAFAEAKKKAPNTPTPAVLKLLSGNHPGIRTWRDLVVEELTQAEPYGVYIGVNSFNEAKKVLALFGVKVGEPVLPKPAAAVKAATKAVHTAAKKAKGFTKAQAAALHKLHPKKPRKAGAKK